MGRVKANWYGVTSGNGRGGASCILASWPYSPHAVFRVSKHAICRAFMDLSGHHSNPPAPVECLLHRTYSQGEGSRKGRRTRATEAPGGALSAAHPRHGRIIDAISRVLNEEREPMHARAVHARVEALLGESVRWASVKATLAGNLAGPQPRFVRVARGRYRAPSPRTQG